MTNEKTNMPQTKQEADNQLAIARDKANIGLVQATLNKDWKGVKDEFRVRFVARLCEQLSIPPVLNPFRFIEMKGATVLYADKRAANLIANYNKISVEMIGKPEWDKEKQILRIFVRASRPDGSFCDEFASLHIGAKSGEDRANQEMKCMTKAKRRAILGLVDLAIPSDDDIEYTNETQQVTPAPQRIENKSNLIDSTPEDERQQALSDLFDTVTGGDGKKMSFYLDFVAKETQGKKPIDLTYDECHSLIHKWEEIVKSTNALLNQKASVNVSEDQEQEQDDGELFPSPENNAGL